MRRAIILLALLGGAAEAQRRDGDYGRPVRTPETMADMAMMRAVGCAMSKSPPAARKVLDTAIGSEEENDRVKMLRGLARDCFPLQWAELPATPIRNVLAEITYRRDYQTLPAVPQTAAPASFAVVPAGQQGTPQQQASWQLAAIARCVVFAGAPQAHEFIDGPRNVPEEVRRFEALKPAIGQCIAADQAAALTPRLMRGPVATAMLARATAAGKK